MSTPTTITIDGVEFIRKDSIKKRIEPEKGFIYRDTHNGAYYMMLANGDLACIYGNDSATEGNFWVRGEGFDGDEDRFELIAGGKVHIVIP